MLTFYVIFTIIATVATIGPVYKIRHILARLFYIPFIGWAFSLGYGIVVSYILLTLFSFGSSTAGLANLTASILFSVWMYWEHKKLEAKKQVA